MEVQKAPYGGKRVHYAAATFTRASSLSSGQGSNVGSPARPQMTYTRTRSLQRQTSTTTQVTNTKPTNGIGGNSSNVGANFKYETGLLF